MPQVKERTRTERFELDGHEILQEIKKIIAEGNARRIIIKSEEGTTLIEIPLTVGVVGALLVPAWAALGAIAAIVTKATIEVELVDEPDGDD